MGIGSDLREAREQRGLTLRDISDRTKIRQAVLRAIENDDFRGLPGSVIMRGFLKLYAREVGLDPDEFGRRYTEEVEVPAADEVAAQAQVEDAESGASRRRVARVTVGAVALLAVLVVGYRYARPTSSSRSVTETARQADPQTPAADPTTPSTGAPAPGGVPSDAAPGAAATPAAASAAAAEGLRVELHATEASWIAATADGQQVAYRVVGAGERVELRVKNEAVLRIGVPTGVSVSVNGRPLKPYGRPGMPTTLRITPGNYRDLLAPP